MVFEILPFVALALVQILVRARGAHPPRRGANTPGVNACSLSTVLSWIGTTSISRLFLVIEVHTASATCSGETSPAIGFGLRPVTAHIPASLTNVGLITDTPTPVPQSSSRRASANPRT